MQGAAAADPDAVARGAYLAAAAGCDQCHTDTAHHGAPFAGGRVLDTPYGAIPTPNITPDKATGIGAWSMADFVRAMRWGIAPDDTHYLPVFPFPFYARLSDGDLADLQAFLDSRAPVSRPDPAGPGSIALIGRTRAAIAVALTAPATPWRPDPHRDAVWNRGAYLVATVGRCGDCHTARDALGRPEQDRRLGGGISRLSGKKAPNITPDHATGIGDWSAADIEHLLETGETPDFDLVGGDMAEIVHNMRRLTEADRRAIVVYLKSVPAVSSPAKK
ncbi:MAG TPA: cytochrome c [Stellaceae bacterium]|nr:cytochrome c [Stellaceae bacterium]